METVTDTGQQKQLLTIPEESLQPDCKRTSTKQLNSLVD